MKKLKVGDDAPKFWERSVKGDIVNLDKYVNSYTLVAFLRYSGCPWCNLALHRLTLESSLLTQSNCKVIAFLPSSKENIQKNIYERHARVPEFPVIADSKREVYQKYGVVPSVAKTIGHIKHMPHWVKAVKEEGFDQTNIDANVFLAPAMFLIDRDLKIIKTDYNANLYEHETFTEIYDSIAVHQLV